MAWLGLTIANLCGVTLEDNPEGSTGPECSGISNDGHVSVLIKSYIALGLVT